MNVTLTAYQLVPWFVHAYWLCSPCDEVCSWCAILVLALGALGLFLASQPVSWVVVKRKGAARALQIARDGALGDFKGSRYFLIIHATSSSDPKMVNKAKNNASSGITMLGLATLLNFF